MNSLRLMCTVLDARSARSYGNQQAKSQYFRGSARVHAEIYRSELNKSLRIFNLLSVPLTYSRELQLEAD
jgi:hypothetical protein